MLLKKSRKKWARKWVEDTCRKSNVFKMVHTDLYMVHLPVRELANLVQEYKTYEWHIWDYELLTSNVPAGLGFALDELKDRDVQLGRWLAFINRNLETPKSYTFMNFALINQLTSNSYARATCSFENPML